MEDEKNVSICSDLANSFALTQLKFTFSEKTTKIRAISHGLDIYLVNLQAMRKIAQILAAFTDKLNFNLVKVKLLNWTPFWAYSISQVPKLRKCIDLTYFLDF